MPARSRRWLPGVVVAAAVAAAASAAGAQVEPVERRVWAASCVAPGPGDLFVYGRGWGDGPVTIVVGQAGGSVTPASGVFQTRIGITAPGEGEQLSVTASQPGGAEATHQISVSGSCSPTVAATVGGNACAAAGDGVPVFLTVDRAPGGPYTHYVDLFGPAETISRFQPPAGATAYTVTVLVKNVPDRVVPVTVEARATTGASSFATTSVRLPPTCPAATSTTSTAPATTAPRPTETTAAPGTTAPPPPTTASPGPVVVPVPSFGAPPASTSLSLSPAVGQAGQATTVTGTGFGPSTTVLLRWRPGIGQWTITAGGDGSFRTQVLVLPNDIEGPRVLEAVGAASASARFLVVRGSQQPAFGGVFVRG